MKKVLFLLVISFFLGFLNASSLYEKLINKETISVGTEGIYRYYKPIKSYKEL